MTGSLFWRAKVVHSIAAMVFLILVSFNCRSQSAHPVKITYSCKLTSLEIVLDHLSKTSGVYFVYSSNKIVVTEPVSLSVKDRPLKEVLTLLGKQLNLSFTIRQHHVMVKAIDRPSVTKNIPVVGKGKTDGTLTTVQTSRVIDSVFEKHSLRELDLSRMGTSTNNLLPSSNYVERQLTKLQPYFDTAIVKQVPIQYIRKLNTNNLHRGWFISVGPMMNNFSKGFEMQAGLRQIYAVFSPTWLESGKFHGAYGLGTSLPLSRNFFLNPVYSFAKVSQSEIISTGRIPYREDQTINHHQVKLLLQYAISKNISIRVGPTLNQVKTIYKYQYPEIRTFIVNNGQGFFGSGTGLGPDKVLYNANLPITSAYVIKNTPVIRTNNFNVGWEASLSYKLNFFHKP
ncbi:MAG: STN domain-containing protein [Chryseolinea sp.]